jgi:hypothetical protein
VSHEEHFELPKDITVPPTSLWARMPMIGGAMAVVGLGVTIGMFASDSGKVRAMFAFLWGFEYWLSIALGCFCFVLIQHVVRAGWSTVVRRIAENAMMTLPVFFPLFLVIGLVGAKWIFPWTVGHETDESMERKRWFLTEGPWWTRAIIYFVIWTVCSYLLYSWSTRQDSAKTADERDSLSRKMWILSAPGLLLYGLSETFQAVDWMKSLSPHWYSTMWGVYYFAGSILAAYAFITLIAAALQRAGMIKTAVTIEHFHDLGKLMFGHTIFWAYIAFAQFMLQWYANIPEETDWWMHRLHGGWAPISYSLPIIHFAIPFLYIVSRHVKRNMLGVQVGAIWYLIVHAIDHYWIVLPNFTGAEHVENMAKAEAEHAASGAAAEVISQFSPHFVDFFAFIGIAGVFFAAFGFFMNRNKVICINDPRLQESMEFENY